MAHAMKEHASLPLPDYVEYPQEEMIARAKAFYRDIGRRHSTRDFSDRAVPREIIDNCIRAAGTAPSGANHQPWHFAVIGSAAAKKDVREKAEIEECAFYDESGVSVEVYTLSATLLRGLVSNGFSASGR